MNGQKLRCLPMAPGGTPTLLYRYNNSVLEELSSAAKEKDARLAKMRPAFFTHELCHG